MYRHVHIQHACTHEYMCMQAHMYGQTCVHAPHTHSHAHIHICTHTHAHTYAHMHIYAHTRAHTRTHTCTHIHTLAHTHTKTCTRAHMHTRTRTYVDTCMCAYLHACTQAHTVMHTHPCGLEQAGPSRRPLCWPGGLWFHLSIQTLLEMTPSLSIILFLASARSSFLF